MNPPSPPLPRSWIPPRILLNVLLAGVLLRLIGMGWWSLWLDEGATWSWAVAADWKGTFYAEANHPPLWWMVTRGWISLFGDSESALRAPAAILGLVSVVLVWFLALRVLDPAWAPSRGGFSKAPDGGRGRKLAAWFTGLVAVSGYFLEYGQEARMYTALLVETLLLCLLYLCWLDRKSKVALVLYAIVGGLALYTHYFAVWPLIAHAAHALWLGWQTRKASVDQRVNPWPLFSAVAVSGLLFVPWFLYLLGSYEGIAHIAPEPFSYVLYTFWRMGAGPGLVVGDRLTQIAGPESIWAENAPIIVGVAVIWFVPMLLGIVALAKRPGLRSFLGFNLLLPIGSLLAVYALFPLIHERYLIFVAPWIFLLVVLGAFSVPRLLRPILLGLVLILSAVGIVMYHGTSQELVPVDAQGRVLAAGSPEAEFPWRYMPDPESILYPIHGDHPYGREPWRDAHAFVRARSKPDDLVVLHPWYVHLAWDYYATHAQDRLGRPLAPLESVHLPKGLLTAEEIVEQYGDQLRERNRVFLVLAHEETEDPDDYYKALVAALGRIWIAEGHGLKTVKPILFHLSWGVRVAVFTKT